MKKENKIGLYLEESNLNRHKYVNEELFREMKDTPEEEKPILIEKIINNNLRLIHYIIKKRYPNINQVCQSIRVTYDDFFSTGYYGLLKSVHTFDVDKGYKFATYATMCIHNEFGMFMRKHKRSFTDISMQTVTHSDGNALDSDLTLLDMLIDESEDMEEVILGEFGFLVIEEMERQLKPRELAILRAYISDEQVTHTDVAQQFGISQSYVSRIINRTLTKCKKIYHRLEVV